METFDHLVKNSNILQFQQIPPMARIHKVCAVSFWQVLLEFEKHQDFCHSVLLRISSLFSEYCALSYGHAPMQMVNNLGSMLTEFNLKTANQLYKTDFRQHGSSD